MHRRELDPTSDLRLIEDISVQPLSIVLLTVPSDRTSRVPPPRTMMPLLVWPEETVNVSPLRTVVMTASRFSCARQWLALRALTLILGFSVASFLPSLR